jgi:hypothetical protein
MITSKIALKQVFLSTIGRRSWQFKVAHYHPACDFVPAWTLFSSESEGRDAFRTALSIDDASWARSRGWALSTGLIALPYYLDTNPVIVAMARRQIDEVLADRKRSC